MRDPMIHTPHEYAAYVGARTDGALSCIERSCQGKVYRQTSCGAYVEWYYRDDQLVGIRLSSIVEGSDQTARHPPLLFPFSPDDYEEALSYIEDEVQAIIEEESA